MLSIGLLALHRHGYPPPEVTYLGKAATLNLLYAFPLLLLSVDDTTLAHVVRPLAWAFTVWGAGLYLWSGWLYLVEERKLIVTAQRASNAGPILGRLAASSALVRLARPPKSARPDDRAESQERPRGSAGSELHR